LSRKKWIEKPKNIEPKITVITENLTDNSLPYLVYKNNAIKDANPIPRNTHAKT
jgi:hypothetical protein